MWTFLAFSLAAVALWRSRRIKGLEQRLEFTELQVTDLQNELMRARIAATKPAVSLLETPVAIAEPKTPREKPSEPKPVDDSHPKTPQVDASQEPLPAIAADLSADTTTAQSDEPQSNTDNPASPIHPSIATPGMAKSAAPTKAKWPSQLGNFEELLGGQLALKAGVGFVVLGMAFFLAYALGEMGPWGRIGTGFAVASAMLGLGLYAERLPRYLSFGRALIAGGFGIAYFVAFATHHIPAAQVITSPAGGSMALFAVGAIAVAFSLRYNHQWTTTTAFLLIYAALGLAATEQLAAFDLAGTTMAGVGLAVIAAHRRWLRLLALGTLAAWSVGALWLAPHVSGPEAATPIAALSVAATQIALLWLAIQWALTWVLAKGDGNASSIPLRWPMLTLLGNGAGGLGLGLYCVHHVSNEHTYIVALVFGLSYLAQAFAFKRMGQLSHTLYLASATLAVGALGLTSPLRLGFTHEWVPLMRLFGIQLLLGAGIILKERYFRALAYGAFAFTCLQLLDTTQAPAIFNIPFRTIAWSIVAVVAGANTLLFATRWRHVLGQWEVPSVHYASSSLSVFFMAALAWVALPESAIPAALGLLAVILMLIYRHSQRVDFIWQAASLAGLALVAFLENDFSTDQSGSLLSAEGAGAMALVASLYAVYGLTLRPHPSHLAKPNSLLSQLAPVLLAIATLTYVAVSFVVVPNLWLGPTFALGAVLHAAGGFNLRRISLWWACVGLAGLCATTVGFYSFDLMGSTTAWRSLLIVVLSITLLWVVFDLYRRAQKRDEPAPLGPVSAGMQLYFATLPTFLFAGFVKLEALAHDKNLVVAVIWAAAALLYATVARRLRTPSLTHLAHVLMAFAIAHLIMVNLPQTGDVGIMSLRLFTTLPVLAIAAYFRQDWLALHGHIDNHRYGTIRPTYLYATVGVVALLVLVELHRSWVVVGWSVMSVALLWRSLRNKDVHWHISASLMGVATLERGLGANLYFRDLREDLRQNLIVLPLALLGLAGNYLQTLGHSTPTAEPSLGRKTRYLLWTHHGWFWSMVLLLSVFIWLEASGTLLTVFYSLQGFALIALGFGTKDRIARLCGLGFLALCVLKLFIYDLRGLSGLPRIASFVVLGLVLIAVSFGYTRFRDRAKELLQ